MKEKDNKELEELTADMPKKKAACLEQDRDRSCHCTAGDLRYCLRCI